MHHRHKQVSDKELASELSQTGEQSLQYAMQAVLQRQQDSQGFNPGSLVDEKNKVQEQSGHNNQSIDEKSAEFLLKKISTLSPQVAFELIKTELASSDQLNLGAQIALLNKLLELDGLREEVKDYVYGELLSGKAGRLSTNTNQSEEYFKTLLNDYFVVTEDSNEVLEALKKFYDREADKNNQQYLIQLFSDHYPEKKEEIKNFITERGLAEPPSLWERKPTAEKQDE